MKLKQIAAGVLAGAVIVAGMPSLGPGGITAHAEEGATVNTGPIRYRSIPSDEMKISTDWAVRDTAPLENALSDAPNFALSRYNTGGIPRSSEFTDRNKIYVKMDEAADVTKLVWWPNEDKVSGGRGENVGNGTVTRLKVSYTTQDLTDKTDADGMAVATWVEQEGDVRFDSAQNDNADDSYGVAGVAHNIELSNIFDTAPKGVTGVKLEILNTAGVYDFENDRHDVFISGRELQIYTGDTAVPHEKLNAYADFACEDNETNGHFGIDKLVDGNVKAESNMHSVWGTTANNPDNSDQAPFKTDRGEYFANNNIYLDLSKTRQIGKLTYVSGTSVGSIQRCNIYVSDAQLEDGKEPKDITDWELAYTNVPTVPEDGGQIDTSGDWPVFNPQANINGNSHEALFTTMHEARYVRIEVKNTRGTRTAFSNKWINIGRLYVYDAESVYTGERANVALGSRGTTIQAYTGKGGHQDSSDPECVINGLGNNASDMNQGAAGSRWLGSAVMKTGASGDSTGKVNYLILDLGEDASVRNLDAINLRWAAKGVANSYWIDTSDTCDETGDVTNGAASAGVNISKDDIQTEGWDKVVDFTDGRARTSAPQANKLDEFKQSGLGGDGELLTTELKRYVRLVLLDMHHEAPSYHVAALKEFEIWGIRETGHLNTVELDLEVPVYKGALRSPGTKASERYHLDSFEYYKKGEANPLNKTSDTFDAGTYILEAKIGTLLPFGNQLQASVNGETAEIEPTDESCSCGEGGRIVKVTYEFTINDPTEAKAALQAVVDRQDIKAVIDAENRNEKGELVYTVRSWDRLNKAYSFAKDMLGFKLDPDGGSSSDTQEVWYLKRQYEAAATELEQAYESLRLLSGGTEVDMNAEPLDVTVTPPSGGQTPLDAVLTNPGTVENENLDLVKGEGFRVDDDNFIHGTVTAPNSSPKNDVFKIEGETNFLIYFKTIIPTKPDGKQSIVGRFNQGYGLQIEPRSNDAQGRMNLIAYGFGSKEGKWQGDSTLHRVWPTTKMPLPNDWYGKEHTVVAIFNGGYFDLFVDGVKATEVQTHNWLNDDGEVERNKIDSSPLKLSDDASFSIGFNVQDNNERFSGGLKDFAMYIGENCPDHSGFTAAAEQGPEAFASALANAIQGKDADLTLTGSVTKYQLRSTEWKAVDGDTKTPVQAGETFDRYTDYEVTVTAQTSSGYYFPDAAEGHVVLRSDADTTLDAEAKLSEDGTEITITYLFKGEEHPFDSLSKYLDGLTIEGIPNKETNADADGTRIFTAASWENYIGKYNAAKALVEAGKTAGKEEEYSNAKDALEAAAAVGTEGGLLLAAQNCECKLGEITFADDTINLDSASAQKTLAASCSVNSETCMKHQTAPAAGEPVYTAAAGNTAGASVSGSVLTVTKEGSVEVTASVTLMDGTRKVDEKTKTAVFTVQSTPVTDRAGSAEQLDRAVGEVRSALSGLDSSKYTQESWDALQEALEDAEKLSEKLKNTTDRVTVNEFQALLAKLDVNSLVEEGGSGEEESVEKLRDLLDEIYKMNDKKSEYTVETWNAMIAIYNQAADLLNGGNPDPAECEKLLGQLTALKNALKTNAEDQKEAADEVNAKIAAADAVIAAGQGTYSKTTWDAFVAAYNAAKNPPAGATAAKLRELAKALADAQAALAPEITVTQTVTLKAGDSQKYKDVEYRVLNAAAKTAVAYKGQKKKAKSVVIASTVKIKGVTCKVVQISANAFKGYNKMTKLTIGANVTTIGKKAFMNCSKLKTIKLRSKGLKKVQSNAFKKVKGKVKVNWPKGMKAKAKNTLKKNLKKAGLKVK